MTTKPRRGAYEALHELVLMLDEHGPMTRRDVERAMGLDIKAASVLLVRAHRQFACVHISAWRRQPDGMREPAPVYAAWPGDDVPKPRPLTKRQRRERELVRHLVQRRFEEIPRSVFDLARVGKRSGYSLNISDRLADVY